MSGAGPNTEDLRTAAELHEFRLYRSGWTDDLPWDDNQLWASGIRQLMPDAANTLSLEPMYGHAASWYQVDLTPGEQVEQGWVSWRVKLVIDAIEIGYPSWYPLTWYAGNPSDWPSGLVRFPERVGPPMRDHPRWGVDGPRGVWTLAVRRAS